MIDLLKENGWYLSQEGISICKEGVDKASVSSIIRKALNCDLREIGGSFLSEEIYKSKVEYISGPCVLQVQKIKNVCVPKYEASNHGPVLYRLHATDGCTNINCLQWGQWKSLNLDTPPGTKICIKNCKVPVQNGFLLLSENHFIVLGGHVPAMVEKWELSKQFASHVRRGDNLDDGPPPWIPFGKSIDYRESKASANDFKSLEQDAKDQKEDALFRQQRQATIAQASKAKEGKVKVFGGGKEKNINKSEDSSFEKPYKSMVQGNYKRGQMHRESATTSNLSSAANKPYDDFKPQKVIDEAYKGHSSKAEGYRKEKDANKKPDFRNKPEPNVSGYANKNQMQNYNRGKNDYERTNYGNHLNRNEDVMSNRMSQMKIQENSNRPEKDHAFSNTQLKPETRVLARYWEDSRFYPAVIHAVGENGTCVVHFVEYGNYEEVRVSDIRPASPTWTQSPDVMNRNSVNHHLSHPPERNNFSGVLEFRRGGNKPFVHHAVNEDHSQDRLRERSERSDHRPSIKLYQVPHYRHNNG